MKLKKIEPIEWKLSKKVKQAILVLKKALIKEPVLKLPNFDKLFEIQTNVSKYVIGSVLYQKDEKGKKNPIQYGSQVLTPIEQKYSTTKREMLVVYTQIRYWKAYLWSRQFTVYTYHSSLIGINTNKDIIGQKYDFKLVYLLGKKNVTGDVLLCMLIAKKNIKEIEKAI